MPKSSDRSGEWSILRTVYNELECERARHSDLPDFVMTAGPTSLPFGVEVTEMFRSESEARAINHPDYLARLFSGGEHMHRDDRQTLQIETVLVHQENGAEHSIPAVVTAGEPIRVRYEQLAGIIRKKSTRPFQSGLHHVSLIIRDRYDLMGDKREPYSVTTILECGVREALLASPFRGVYWITVIEQNDEQVYRPLRLLMMLEQFYLFGHSSEEWHRGDAEISPQDAVLMFKDYCVRSGIEVHLRWTRDRLWVVHNGVAIGLGDKGIEILDNRDWLVPDDEIRERADGDAVLTDEQFAKASVYIRANGFSCEHYNTAATPANLRYPTMTAFRLKPAEEQDDASAATTE